MPRKFKLTWQPGINGRAGRWMKIYKGKRHYFPGGSGKYDREAYEAAWDAWEDKKREIDAATPKPHQADYEQAINKWELVLAWCRKHSDEDEMAELAMAKLTLLRKRFSQPKPRPIQPEDTLDGRFEPPIRYPGLNSVIQEFADSFEPLPVSPTPFPVLPGPESAGAAGEAADSNGENAEANSDRRLIVPNLDIFQDPLKTEEAVWQDRLEVMQRAAAPPEQTVKANIDRFLDVKKAEVDAGELSEGRLYMLRLHINQFADWVGHDTAVTEINAQTLSDYRLELLKQVEAKKWSSTTAKDRMGNVKSLVFWLFEIEAIPAIPRVMAGKSKALQITAAHTTITVFTTDEVTQSLDAATDRTKLYILLMLNCGMTQKDIADLLKTEVDWDDGRVTRKRSKTKKHKNVPIVSYRLWPETLRLLRQEQAGSESELVLLSANGRPLWHQDVMDDGKYKKTDSIKNAFYRLSQTTKIKKPLKSLKKTSATLIRGNEKYASLESLFLGHAPQTMADKHYAAAPQELLDEAIEWLGREYGLY